MRDLGTNPSEHGERYRTPLWFRDPGVSPRVYLEPLCATAA